MLGMGGPGGGWGGGGTGRALDNESEHSERRHQRPWRRNTAGEAPILRSYNPRALRPTVRRPWSHVRRPWSRVREAQRSKRCPPGHTGNDLGDAMLITEAAGRYVP